MTPVDNVRRAQRAAVLGVSGLALVCVLVTVLQGGSQGHNSLEVWAHA